jgi:GT2 family glycosyltransferase
MIELSISIVNFNTKEPLRRCLKSIQNTIGELNYEVIVVDNNSKDGSAEMLRNEFAFVKLIANKENKGATVAKNQSFRQAKGRYVLILDSDIEILPGAIEEMFHFMDMNPKVGVLGPSVLFPNHQPQHSCNKSAPNLWSSFLNKFLFFANLRYRFYRSKLGDLYLKRRYNKPKEFVWLGGMCLLVRQELIQQIGGMDEIFFIYYDDTDFCLRTRNAGWKVYYLPSASVIHHMSKGVGQFSNFLYPKIFESELYFFKKYYGIFQVKICAIFIQLAMILRMLLVLSLFLLRIKRDYLRKRLLAYRQVFGLAKRNLYEKAN